VRSLKLYSDTCGGQNRNINFSMMCLRAVRNLNIESIEHIYMESGHSQMECDSVHSVIELACRNKNIYCPTDYYRVVGDACVKRPYKVVQVSTEDFTDYKKLTSDYVRNRSKCTNGDTVKWLHIKRFKYEKVAPNRILFSYDYDDVFSEMIVNVGGCGRRRTEFPLLSPLYKSPTPINPLKWMDLISLCDSLAIPRDYHGFYKSLTFSDLCRNALTEPDILEDENEDMNLDSM